MWSKGVWAMLHIKPWSAGLGLRVGVTAQFRGEGGDPGPEGTHGGLGRPPVQ